MTEKLVKLSTLLKPRSLVVDFVHRSQIKTDEDREYLKCPEGYILIQTFCSKRELRCSEYCNDWIKNAFLGRYYFTFDQFFYF